MTATYGTRGEEENNDYPADAAWKHECIALFTTVQSSTGELPTNTRFHVIIQLEQANEFDGRIGHGVPSLPGWW